MVRGWSLAHRRAGGDGRGLWNTFLRGGDDFAQAPVEIDAAVPADKGVDGLSRLISKSRDGAKVKKLYDKPKTPFQRVVEDPSVGKPIKARLRAQLGTLNPVELKRKIVDVQERLEAIAVAKAKVKQFSNPPIPKALWKGKTVTNLGCGRSHLKTAFVVGLWCIFQEEVVLGHPPVNALLLRGRRIS